MLPDIKRQLTHWVDGMKIHKQHFTDSENALLDQLRDSTALRLTNFNFGLLHPSPTEKRSIDLKIIRAQHANFKIVLSHCRAVTAGGCRIEILPGDDEVVCEDSVNINISVGVGSVKPFSFLGVVTIDIFNRIPSGEPSAEETPPRNPYARPKYSLHLIPEEEINSNDFGAYHLPVTRFETRGDVLVIDETYIPPCASIKGHSAMVNLYNTISSNFNHIQEYSTSIVQKVVGKSQNSPLAQNVKLLCDKSVRHISAVFFSFRNIVPQMPPVYLAESVVQLASVLKTELDFMPEKEKEDMLQYFKEWNDISASAFEGMLSAVIETEYNHNQIYQSFSIIIEFSTKWMQLLEKLSELELIGRRKEKDIFVGKVYQDKKKGFSLLD